MTHTKVFLLKRKDAQIVIEHVVTLWPRALYIKVTEKSLITSDTTVLADSRVWQLGSLVVTQTGLGNLLALKLHLK
jgi:hypothetical protein